MSPSVMFSHNLSLVLKLIKNHGPLSRADISRIMQSSKSTISANITMLEELGLVKTVGNGNPKTGRKSVLYAFNPQAAYVVAIDLRWKKINIALVDMAGGIQQESSYHRTQTQPDILIERLVDNVRTFIDHANIPQERIEGIGIMVPGIVEPQTGVVHYSLALQWDQDVDLVTPFQQAFNKKTTVFNDANALALSEMWIAGDASYKNFAFIYTEGGVGGACVLDGNIILGANGAAGEFGKMLIAGPNGCQRAEHVLSLPSLLARFGNEDPTGKSSDEIVQDVMRLLMQHTRENETLRMIDSIIEDLSQMIVGITAVFNPDAFIFNCSYIPEPASFLELLRARVRSYLPSKPQRNLNFVPSILSDREEVLGAAAAAISQSRFSFVLQNGNSEIEGESNYFLA